MPKQRKISFLNQSLSILLVAASMIISFCTAQAFAKDGAFDDLSPFAHEGQGAVISDRMLELDTASSDALRLEGEQSMRDGNFNRAITMLQHALEMEPADMDGRLLYAEALEKKLLKQKDRDPVLYNQTVKQWLYIAKKAEFHDQNMQALQHLETLTGTKPQRFESPARFLARVLIAEDGSTKVALGGKKPDPDDAVK